MSTCGMGVDAVTTGLLIRVIPLFAGLAVTALIQNIIGKLIRYVPEAIRPGYISDVLEVNRLLCGHVGGMPAAGDSGAVSSS